MTDLDRARDDEPNEDQEGASAVPERRVVHRRDPADLTAEERAFLARQRVDRPPHYDSAWG